LAERTIEAFDAWLSDHFLHPLVLVRKFISEVEGA